MYLEPRRIAGLQIEGQSVSVDTYGKSSATFFGAWGLLSAHLGRPLTHMLKAQLDVFACETGTSRMMLECLMDLTGTATKGIICPRLLYGPAC